MELILHRQVIYPKDITRVTGCSLRKARKILADIRARYNKDCQAYVTVAEFCAFTGIPEQMVKPFLL